jgi:hypothetical protein
VLLAGLHDRRIRLAYRVTCLGRVKRWGSPRSAQLAFAPIKPMPVIVKSTWPWRRSTFLA